MIYVIDISVNTTVITVMNDDKNTISDFQRVQVIDFIRILNNNF